ncbi:sodium-dependent transporter [Pelolinea submarina]|uniref:Transporter n=1 Tax=Pelolinea submarina TaxID=913107 RepID=A0A347ZNF9_9CHLR|nr:sodium-dependent transporter [Pelolinea submarina]REG08442.1 NSS family neurotransmitter:Na+ symporter [Pelolinea submarina]BBB46840.1 neurotransmitter:Na+ symporter, NSS family [Pelolinea submarina]
MKEVSKKGNHRNSERFSTGIGVLMATLGSAVGLGNIWKFPYLTGSNGGAAFLIVYIICTILVGFPILVAEHMLGRKGRGDAVSTFENVAPKSAWWVIGASGILAAFLIMAFYTEVAGWVFAYVFKSFGSGLLSTDPEVTSSIFASLVSNPVQSLIWQWIVLAVVGAIIMLGVAKGIEGTTKRLLPILALLLIIIGIRSITLPGAGQGLSFLFKPDFSKITAPVILTAMGLAFFKLSIGMGCMLTYGSYYSEDQNIPKNAARVVAADLTVSILAGIAIFPAVFSFGFEPAAGTQLLFITIPSVFASMPLGGVFMVAFFLLTAFAAIGAMISLVEVVVAFLVNRTKLGRKKSTLITVVSMAVVGSLAALSNSTMANVTVFGKTFFDLYDYVSSNILLPVGGLMIAIFATWVWGWPRFKEALSNNGALANEGVLKAVYNILKFVSPVLVAIILLTGLNIVHI